MICHKCWWNDDAGNRSRLLIQLLGATRLLRDSGIAKLVLMDLFLRALFLSFFPHLLTCELYQMTKLASQLWNRQGWELEDTCLVGYWTCVEAYMGQGPMAHVSESQPLKHDHQTIVTMVWWSCLSLMFIFEAFGVMIGFWNCTICVQESNMRFSNSNCSKYSTYIYIYIHENLGRSPPLCNY